jgi:hypothetical protein
MLESMDCKSEMADLYQDWRTLSDGGEGSLRSSIPTTFRRGGSWDLQNLRT